MIFNQTSCFKTLKKPRHLKDVLDRGTGYVLFLVQTIMQIKQRMRFGTATIFRLLG